MAAGLHPLAFCPDPPRHEREKAKERERERTGKCKKGDETTVSNFIPGGFSECISHEEPVRPFP